MARQRTVSSSAEAEAVRALTAAKQLVQVGCLVEAEKQAVAALKKAPRMAEISYLLGVIALRMGRVQEAARRLSQAIRHHPDFAPAHVQLGLIQRSWNHLREAAGCFTRAVHCQPDRPEPWQLLGETLAQLGEEGEALSAFRELAVRTGHEQGEAAACNLLGNALHGAGYVERAQYAYEQAIEQTPDYPLPYLNLGNIYGQRGERETADRYYQQALDCQPGWGEAWFQRAQVHRHRLPEDAGRIQEMEEALTVCPAGDTENRAGLLAALGKAYDETGQYSEAFTRYREANNLRSQAAPPFQQSAITQHNRSVTAFYTQERLDTLSEAAWALDLQSPVPVFIIGMPRSGTTLAEQILAAHPKVVAGGELPYFPQTVLERCLHHAEGMAYPACLGAMNRKALQGIARQYLDHVRPLAPEKGSYVTDKQVDNFAYLGLIHTLLPEAKIIHCVRHPLDVCLSIYFQRFTTGMSWAHKLEDIAFYYQAYHEMMAHWEHVLPADSWFTLDYRSLVEDFEGTVRAMLDYCGLPWDAQVLEFYAQSSTVRTASNWQVRQPIHAGSLDRWQHYHDELQGFAWVLDCSSDTNR